MAAEDDASASIRRTHALRLHRERQRAVSLIPKDEQPLDERSLAQIRFAEAKLEEAQRLRGAKMFSLSKARALEAKRILIAVQERSKENTNQRWATRILAEIHALEILSGGEVDIQTIGDGRPLQLTSRDGLYTLGADRTVAGKPVKARLLRAQLAAGLQYRDLYEKTDPERSLRPKSLDPCDQRTGGGGEGWAEKRGRLWTARAAIDKGIATTCGPRALIVMQEIAGKGRTISSLSPNSGRARERDTQRLEQALTTLANIYSLGDATNSPLTTGAIK